MAGGGTNDDVGGGKTMTVDDIINKYAGEASADTSSSSGQGTNETYIVGSGGGWTSEDTTGATVQTIPVEVALLPPVAGAGSSFWNGYEYASNNPGAVAGSAGYRGLDAFDNAIIGDTLSLVLGGANAALHPIDTAESFYNTVTGAAAHPVDTAVTVWDDAKAATQALVGNYNAAAQNGTLPEFIGATLGHVTMVAATVATDTEELDGAAAAEIPVPSGFTNANEFNQFGATLHAGLAEAGYGDAQGILQGSAVTGVSFRTGIPFDVGRVSDFDVALSGDSLFQGAQDAGIGLRSAGTRTGPLTELNLQQLNLFNLSTQLSSQYGRPVNFMIYNSTTTAVTRAPSIIIPK